MNQAPTASASAAGARPVFVYDGKLSELFGIFLLNLLLTIITFGIFRFWAITRIRRYLWSHMRFEGTRFTYTGKGKELFLGFLLAMLMLNIIFAGAGMIATALAHTNRLLALAPFVLAFIAMLVLYAGARFSAQRYRLSRTEWRGIRGGMEGSAPRYGIAWLLYLLLIMVTLYQAVPWMQLGLARRRISASRFGSAIFDFSARAGRLYLAWLTTLVGYVVLLGAIAAIIAVSERDDLAYVIAGHFKEAGWEVAIKRVLVAVGMGIVAYGVASGLLTSWYYASLARLIVTGTSLRVPEPLGESTLQFSSEVKAGTLLWLFVSNLLIAIVTLGLGIPIVLHRWSRYVAKTTFMTGTFDADALVQSSLARPSLGEGFLQALDPGIV